MSQTHKHIADTLSLLKSRKISFGRFNCPILLRVCQHRSRRLCSTLRRLDNWEMNYWKPRFPGTFSYEFEKDIVYCNITQLYRGYRKLWLQSRFPQHMPCCNNDTANLTMFCSIVLYLLYITENPEEFVYTCFEIYSLLHRGLYY